MWNNKLSTFSNDAYFRVEVWELLKEIKKELEKIRELLKQYLEMKNNE